MTFGHLDPEEWILSAVRQAVAEISGKMEVDYEDSGVIGWALCKSILDHMPVSDLRDRTSLKFAVIERARQNQEAHGDF